MSALVIRPEEVADRQAVRALVARAFGGEEEARLVAALHAAGDVVLSLVARRDETLCGHILFSRLFVVGDDRFAAVALAPISVDPAYRRQWIGAVLIAAAHGRLKLAGERLAVVLGDPDYYGRFGYTHARAAGFESDYQSEALQARAWGPAPETGRLEYPAAFAALGQ